MIRFRIIRDTNPFIDIPDFVKKDDEKLSLVHFYIPNIFLLLALLLASVTMLVEKIVKKVQSGSK